MTLVLTHASTRYVLHVTDRLVTRAGLPFDALANKNLVYRPRDGLVAIGYTGLAYLDGLPTDQWIAEKLTGVGTEGIWPDKPAMSFGLSTRWLDLGQSIELLRTELDAAFSRLPEVWHREPHAVLFAGWQWKRGRARPVLAEIHKPAGRLNFTVRRVPRYWHFKRGKSGQRPTVFIPIPHDHLSVQECNGLADKVTSKPPGDAEQLLVEAVRLVASRSGTVGPNVMSILLPEPRSGQARVRYIPVRPERRLPNLGQTEKPIPMAYSPWFVGPKFILPPSLIAGAGLSIMLGGVTVSLEGPGLDPDHGLVWYMGGQRRRAAP